MKNYFNVNKTEQINHQKAREYFGIQNEPDIVLHHIDPSWKTEDPERYAQWNVEDLVPMERSEHQKLHASGENNGMCGKGYLIQGENNGMYGDHRWEGENNPMYGRNHSKESIEKMIQKRLGKHWYNNGYINKIAYECPEGFVSGKLLKLQEN